MTESSKDDGDLPLKEPAPTGDSRPILDPKVTERTFKNIVIPLVWKRMLAKKSKTRQDYVKLSEIIESMLIGRLRKEGLSAAESVIFARSAMADFNGLSSLRTPEQVDAALDLGVALFRAARKATVDFQAAGQLALPSSAPEIWAERHPQSKENPIQFLNRVWGPWLKVGVLYQDDIKRLGDGKLVRAIRSYCQKHNLKAADVLPPPRKARIERALAEATPGSPEAEFYKSRLRMRTVSARYRRRAKAAVGSPQP